MKVDAEIDRLYGLPLDEFVGERDALAKRLRGGGERDDADRIKALRKPTVGAWALNQALRRRGRERDQLLAAGEKLRDAHEALLAGGDQAAVREAQAAERALAAKLTETAEAIATESGKGGPALAERVRGTLHAAALDEEVREELAAGRVVREREAVGLGAFGATTTTTTPASSGRGAGQTTKASATPESGRRGADRAREGKGRHENREADAARRRDEREAERDREAEAEREHAERLAAAERALDEAQLALADAESAEAVAARELEAARAAVVTAGANERAARKETRQHAREAARREREFDEIRASRGGGGRRSRQQ